MKFYDVVAKKQVPNREKPVYANVGKLIQFDNGGMVLELNHLPGVQYAVYEQRARAEAASNGMGGGNLTAAPTAAPSYNQGGLQQGSMSQPSNHPGVPPSEDISIDDISF